MQKSKVIAAAAALLVSICLWIYVVTVVNPEDTVVISGIPVTFTGVEAMREDYGLIISDGEDATVSLKLTGKRSELRLLSAGNITATVNVSSIRRAKTYTSGYDVTFPANVNSGEISIAERSPGALSYTVERLATKPVEVIGVFEGNPAEGYEVGTMSFDHDTIEVSGTEEVIDQIDYARVVVSRTNLENTVTEMAPYTLVNADGTETSLDDVIVDVSQIEVTLPVSKLKQILFSVNLIDGGGASGANAVVTISPPSVTISGDASVVDGVNQIELGSIDLSQVDERATFEFPILIPNQAKNISGDETATVTVELKGLTTRKLRAGSIEFINQPANLNAESLTSQLTVTVRGPSDQVALVASNNIRAVADLSNYSKAGTYEVPVTIYIDGYDSVGPMDTKTITVSLTGSGTTTQAETPDDPDSAESG